jgi:hypothetical protein
LYDNGGISFSVINTRFTVTKAGLYHFEGTMTSQESFDGNNSSLYALKPRAFISVSSDPVFELAADSRVYTTMEMLKLSYARFTLPFTIDIYLAAGENVTFKLTDYNSALQNQTNRPGYISAYLISE